jgi:hypothetical protein
MKPAENARIDIRVSNPEKLQWMEFAEANGIKLTELIKQAVRARMMTIPSAQTWIGSPQIGSPTTMPNWTPTPNTFGITYGTSGMANVYKPPPDAPEDPETPPELPF